MFERISTWVFELILSHPYLLVFMGLTAWIMGTRFVDPYFAEGERQPKVSFLNRGYRIAVIGSLFLLSTEIAIDHAVHRTVCCDYVILKVLDKVLGSFPAWGILYRLMTTLAACGFLLLFLGTMFVLVWRQHRVLLGDAVFGLIAILNILFIWTAAMGHSEPNWERGYWWVWISGLSIWVLSVLQREYLGHWKPNRFGALNLVIGSLLSFVLPLLMVSLRPYVIYQGLTIGESHVGSTRYLFAIVITTFFWLVDLMIAWRPKGRALAVEQS